MAGPDQSDPLAKTELSGKGHEAATVATSATSSSAPIEIPKTIGRYHVEGVLGQGAMGVVYAAHDPSLDRRVALKVLRDTDAARLTREAKALARLSHPAVVTVHEVGRADGVDYVAMELLDGTTLAEWLTTAKPAAAEVLDAFRVAGSGLAAAHAEGLVHRDFKPQNVLRSKRGKIVVTDFGLARATLEEPPAPARTDTATSLGRAATHPAVSLSSTLTATGAILGTPVYMAPEQHAGSTVGPAADQFAFCVALWEALAGARPFRGQTIRELREHIERGPDPASEGKLPRQLRGVLRRGLAVDPDARWPSMDALLAELHGSRRGRWLAIVGAALLVIAVIVFAIGRRRAGAVPGCGSIDDELAAFRSSPDRDQLARSAAGQRALAALDARVAEWAAVQTKVCANRGDPERTNRVSCLRATRADMIVAQAASARIDPVVLADVDPIALVGDPVACTAARPPRRVITEGEDAIRIAAASLAVDTPGWREPPEPADRSTCTRLSWFIVLARNDTSRERIRSELGLVRDLALQCSDDRVTAAFTIAELMFEPNVTDSRSLRRLDAALDRAGGDRALTAIRNRVSSGHAGYLDQDLDIAIATGMKSVEVAQAIGAWNLAGDATEIVHESLLARGRDQDWARAEEILRRAIATVGPSLRIERERDLVDLLIARGRLDDARRVAAEIVHPPATPPREARAIDGRVVDAANRPVDGARVVADSDLVVTPIGLDPTASPSHVAITATDGRFRIAAAPLGSIVMAEHGGALAEPVEGGAGIELRLRPTWEVSGRLRRRDDAQGVRVYATRGTERVEYLGRVERDGSWRVDHLPAGRFRVSAAIGLRRTMVRSPEIDVGSRSIDPIELDVTTTGMPFHVVLRPLTEQRLSTGIVVVLRGHSRPRTFGDVTRSEHDLRMDIAGTARPGEGPPAVAGVVRTGDALATVRDVPLGPTTACATAISGELGDPTFADRVNRHAATFELACVHLEVTKPDQHVVIEVPPMKRLPE